MTCKALFFDYKNSEKIFFQNNNLDNFDIKLFTKSLNRKTVKELSNEELEQTSALNIYTPSILSKEVINKFKNLRVIVIRSKNTGNIDLKTCLEKNIAVISIFTDDDSKTAAQSFKAITEALCGCKENRII